MVECSPFDGAVTTNLEDPLIVNISMCFVGDGAIRRSGRDNTVFLGRCRSRYNVPIHERDGSNEA